MIDTEDKPQSGPTFIVHHEIDDSGKGGLCCIAYHYPGDSFIRICSSVCSPKDQYSKKIGYRMAFEEMRRNSGLALPLPRYISRHTVGYRMLRDLFNDFCGI